MTHLLLTGVGGRGRHVGTVDSVPLDGLSPSTAYSFSRKLLSAYGGSFYTTNTGKVDVLLDQSGSSRDLAQATAGFRPTPATAGTNSIACGDFDGADDQLTGSTAISNLISNSSGYVIASVLIDAVAANQANVYQNNAVFADSATFIGLFAKNVSGTTPTIFGYNWDGNADSPVGGTTISLATAYVLSWRHEGGTLYQTVNNTELSIASGNTSTMTGLLRLGAAGAGTFLDGKIFEAATFSTIPDATARAALIQDFGIYVGASV